MAVVYGINQPHAELKLSAIDGNSRQLIVDGLQYRLQDTRGREIANSTHPSVTFEVPEGEYEIIATYQNQRTQLTGIQLKHSERTEMIMVIPLKRDPESYWIDHEDDFNSVTEYQRRQLERNGQHAYGKAADALAEPVSRDEAQARRNRHYAKQMGPKAHPLLQKPQFDGMDPQVNPKPDENEGVELALEQQLQEALQLGQSATPTPPTGAI